MEVKLIKVEGCVVGWSMEGEIEEMKKGYQRHQFFGFEDTEIVYAGRKGGDYVTDPGVLSWKQKHDTSSPKK
jgi:hypothetical protein